MWKLDSDYNVKVEINWKVSVKGVLMFRLVVKLKRLKWVLKEINREIFNDIEKIKNKCL